MKRREFVVGLGSAAASTAWSRSVRSQPSVPLVGFLTSGTVDAYVDLMAAFSQGLSEMGFIVGKNVVIVPAGADGQFEKTQRLAAELVSRGAAVIVATGNGSARAVQAINKTVPLIFLSQTDPVMAGLVTSLNRPGGNATGVSLLAAQLIGKRLDIVRQLAPGKVTALLRNPKAAEAASQLGEVLEAAHEVGQQIQVLDASTLSEIEAALAAFAKTTASTLILPSDPFLFSHHRRIVELAALHAIPAIYDRREFTLAGGLMSYGTQLSDAYRLIGIYTGKILKGAKPADLPVQQVASFEFVINLKTARAIGLTIPPTVLALADEVIE